jgi:hypothetical protein
MVKSVEYAGNKKYAQTLISAFLRHANIAFFWDFTARHRLVSQKSAQLKKYTLHFSLRTS